MANVFRLPDFGEGLTEGEVVDWLVEVGDPVGVDQPIVELETDKAVTDIPSPYAGVVLYRGGDPGTTIQVGEVLLVVGYEGEEWSLEEEAVEAEPIVGTLTHEVELLGGEPASAEISEDHPKALPLVRKLAREHGIDLAELTGTGPRGRITRDDVLIAAGLLEVSIHEPVAAPEPPPAPEPETSPAPELEIAPAPEAPAVTGDEPEAGTVDETGARRVPMTRMRKTIADRMSRSWAEVPHVTAFDSADASRLLEARQALAARTSSPMPLEALLIKAVIPALVAHPEFNAAVDGDDAIFKDEYNIGIAVDTPDGLIVPVVKGADQRGVASLADEIVRLAAAARNRELTTSEITGTTFTISNIGAVGGGYGTPIIPLGTSAILSVGRAEEQAVVRRGSIQAAPVMPLSLSYDHRLIDGALGRRFLAMIVENLEEPALFLAG